MVYILAKLRLEALDALCALMHSEVFEILKPLPCARRAQKGKSTHKLLQTEYSIIKYYVSMKAICWRSKDINKKMLDVCSEDCSARTYAIKFDGYDETELNTKIIDEDEIKK